MQPKTYQFIYHPENDWFIANKLIGASKLNQHIDISKLTILELNRPINNYWEEMKKVDVIILLIGSTFDRVAPFIYQHDNFLCEGKGVFGIDVCPLPNQWGETKKKRKIWLQWNSYFLGKSMQEVIKIYTIPSKVEGYEYVRVNLPLWVGNAFKFAQSGYV